MLRNLIFNRFTINKLGGLIIAKESKHIVKKNRIIVQLAKVREGYKGKDTKHWKELLGVENEEKVEKLSMEEIKSMNVSE